MSDKQKTIAVDVPEQIHRQFKSKVASEGTTMMDQIRKWIVGWLRGDPQPVEGKPPQQDK